MSVYFICLQGFASFDQNSLPTACIYFTFIHFYLSFHLVLRSNVTVHNFKIELSRAYKWKKILKYTPIEYSTRPCLGFVDKKLYSK
jgi:hypothetical protein